jgi:superfamily II DNA or RNA helicase
MISEGTNIPRLQVCCHLTNIKTEMHFRQILGRILRMTNSENKEAVMYIPAEPKLLEYAYRVKQDVPFEADIVKFEKMETIDDDNIDDVTFDKIGKTTPNIELLLDRDHSAKGHKPVDDNTGKTEEHFLTSSYDKVVNIFGKFKQESIALGLSELK